MKLRHFPLSAICTSVLALSSSAFAATLYWDGTDTTANADGGPGTWNTINTNWDAAVIDGADVTWNNAAPDSAVFVGTAGTVTLGGPISANKVTISTDGYVITGNTLTLAAGGMAANGNAEIASAISLGANQSWTVAGTKTLTVSSGFQIDSSRTLTKEGAGTLTLLWLPVCQ